MAIIVQMANVPSRDTATHPSYVLAWELRPEGRRLLKNKVCVTFLELLCAISLTTVFSVNCLGWFC